MKPEKVRFFNPSYAEIYEADGSTPQTIPTGTTYTKLTGFTTNGSSYDATSDADNDKITLTRKGKYLVNCSINASTNLVSTFKYSIFINGVEQSQCHAHRKYANANDNGSSSISGIINVTDADLDLDLRARHDLGGNVELTPTYMNLTITYIGS